MKIKVHCIDELRTIILNGKKVLKFLVEAPAVAIMNQIRNLENQSYERVKVKEQHSGFQRGPPP
jgi:hypothetical protein